MKTEKCMVHGCDNQAINRYWGKNPCEKHSNEMLSMATKILDNDATEAEIKNTIGCEDTREFLADYIAGGQLRVLYHLSRDPKHYITEYHDYD